MDSIKIENCFLKDLLRKWKRWKLKDSQNRNLTKRIEPRVSHNPIAVRQQSNFKNKQNRIFPGSPVDRTMAQVRFLVEELRSQKPHGMTKRNKTDKNRNFYRYTDTTNRYYSTWKDAQHYCHQRKALCTYYTSTTVDTLKRLSIQTVDEDVHNCWWECKIIQPISEMTRQFLRKFHMHFHANQSFRS